MARIAYVVQIGEEFLSTPRYSYTDGKHRLNVPFEQARLFHRKSDAVQAAGYNKPKGRVRPVKVELQDT